MVFGPIFVKTIHGLFWFLRKDTVHTFNLAKVTKNFVLQKKSPTPMVSSCTTHGENIFGYFEFYK